MRPSSWYRKRTAGSMFCSDVPSVAIIRANWRAASQFSGPWPCSMRARSPRKGTPRKGSSPGPESATKAW